MNLTDYYTQQIELLRTLTVNIQGIKVSIDHLTEAVEDVVESLEKSNEPDSNLGVKLVAALQELSSVLHQKTQYEKSSHDKNYNHTSHNLPYNSRSNSLSTYHPDDYSVHQEANISNTAYPISDVHEQKNFSDEKNQFEKEDHSDYNPMPMGPQNDTVINKASSFPPIPSNNLNSYSSNESFRSRGISRRGRPPGAGGHRSSHSSRARSIHPKVNSLHNRP